MAHWRRVDRHVDCSVAIEIANLDEIAIAGGVGAVRIGKKGQ